MTDTAREYIEDLLVFMEEANVVPVLGADLLTYREHGVDRPLQQVLAERLVDRLQLDPGSLPPGFSLTDVAALYVDGGKRLIEDLYPKLVGVLSALNPVPPPTLLRLAEVRPFRLFVTTTCDSLLADALDAVRTEVPKANRLTYTPADVVDIPSDWASSPRATVFHLFGRVSSKQRFVASENDILEFLSSLEANAGRLANLFGELQRSHLLLIGCGFPDWLSRFFIRTLKRRELSSVRSEIELIADDAARADPGLTLFLSNFSRRTRVFPGSAQEFVSLLVDTYRARFDGRDIALPYAAPSFARTPLTTDSGVFVSYAREDGTAVSRLCAELERGGIDVWFDRRRLHGGELWDAEIRTRIADCALFMPILSHNTEQQDRGYLFREWHLALEARSSRRPGMPFIVPVLIDDTEPVGGANAPPPEFLAATWMTALNGKVDERFVGHLTSLLRRVRSRWAAGEGP